ncbi:hypothetical protein ACIBO4_39370 [Streptomyces sp. NPDC050149]
MYTVEGGVVLGRVDSCRPVNLLSITAVNSNAFDRTWPAPWRR